MQYFQFQHDGDDLNELDVNDGISIGLHNSDRENGYRDDESGPLSWLNSARVMLDPDEDSVTFCASTGDPRGCFTFTLRRKPDGGLIIHMPTPGEGMAHEETRELHPGTLEVGHWRDGGPLQLISRPGQGIAPPAEVALKRAGEEGPYPHRDSGNDGPNGRFWYFTPADRSDPEPEWMELIPNLTREKCEELCAMTGLATFDHVRIEELRVCVEQGVLAGDLEPADLEA